MAEIIGALSSVNLKNVMWIIPVIFFLHEMEEWNILDWYKATYCPPPSSTKLSIRLWLFAISIMGFIVTATAYIIPNEAASAMVILFLVVFTTFNGIQHIYWTFAFKKYAPGVIWSSIGIVVGIVITAAVYSKNIISPAYIIILYAISIPFLIQTIKARNKLIKTFERLHLFTLKMADFMEK